MTPRRSNVSLNFLLNVRLGFLFLLSGIIMILVLQHFMKLQSIREAEMKTKIILDRNLATHHYFTVTLKPDLFELTDSLFTADYFDPVWMSSTFAVRQIDNIFRELNNENYYYKECAVNARNPENEADVFEKDFIVELNENPDIEVRSEVRYIDGAPYFVTLRRGETMEESCMKCHSDPSIAPYELVAKYGDTRSFRRNAGEVVSAISIRIPLSHAYASTRRLTYLLSLLLIFMITMLYISQYVVHKKFLLNPLHMIQGKAHQISSESGHLGESIDIPRGKELQDLVSAFNEMSSSLKKERESLEEKVRVRTKELEKVNILLKEDIREREKIEKEREKLIKELREALDNVKRLRGLLPICSSCKKIREDSGYWTQIEIYIREHSDAEFSHGICPECMKKYYPDMKFDNKNSDN